MAAFFALKKVDREDSMKTGQTIIPVGEDFVSGVVSIPAMVKDGTGVLIAHGAGNDMQNPLVVHLAEGLAEAGYLTVRFNFPYKEKGRKAPDPQRVLVRTWQSVSRFVRETYNTEKIAAAGKSMGGRVASQAAAAGSIQVDRLIFFGYPLHPPGKKDKLRDAHLYDLKSPLLFFAGTRDSLCDLDLLNRVLGKLTAPWSLEIIEGGDHSFNVSKASNRTRQEIYDQVLGKTIAWLGT